MRAESLEISTEPRQTTRNDFGRWPETCWSARGRLQALSTAARILTKNEELRMSWLDIAMAAGAVILVVLIILRKKAR
jgi:hypothetical protein